MNDTPYDLCTLMEDYENKDQGKSSRKSDFFKLDFKKEIAPILHLCKIIDFVGVDKRKAAERLHRFVMSRCQFCCGRHQD